MNRWSPIKFTHHEMATIAEIKKAIDKGSIGQASLKETALNVYMQTPGSLFGGEYLVEYSWTTAVLVYLKNKGFKVVPDEQTEE
jgi:hypothetical protein